jgi:hypothetical protein
MSNRRMRLSQIKITYPGTSPVLRNVTPYLEKICGSDIFFAVPWIHNAYKKKKRRNYELLPCG